MTSLSLMDRKSKVRFSCPPRKELERIVAVTAVEGCLTFLVKWKTEGPEPDYSVVQAQTMNKNYPAEVIKFYENKIQFNESLNTKVQEEENAKNALQLAKRRSIRTGDASEDEDDAATAEIDKEQRKVDRFSTHFTDLSDSDDPNETVLVYTSDDDDDVAVCYDTRN